MQISSRVQHRKRNVHSVGYMAVPHFVSKSKSLCQADDMFSKIHLID